MHDSSGSRTSSAPSRAWLSVLRVLLVCAGMALALGVAFVALLALTLAVTSDAYIEAHLREGADEGVLLASAYPSSPFGRPGHRSDNFTDCIALGMNLGNTRDGLLRRIAASPTVAYQSGEDPCRNLIAALHADNVRAEHGYLRFWHGYQAYIRPLLTVMPLDAFRRLTATLFLGVMVFFAWRLERVFGLAAWPVVLVPFFAVSDLLTASMLTTHALSLTCAFLPAAFVPIILARIPNAREMVLPVFVFAAGAIYNFLNYLINPPLAPALIAFLYIACNSNRDERHTRQGVLYAFGLAGLWFAGFGAAWIEKWLFAALVLGPEPVIAELQRTAAKYEATRVRLAVGFLGASRRSILSSPFFFGYILASIAVAGAIVGWTIRRFGACRTNAISFIAMMTPLLVVVAWVEANRAHSAEHFGFVSRSFVLFSILPLLAAIKLWRQASIVR